MENCLFCKIARGEIPSTNVFENEHIVAFKDLHPLAPVHLLLVTKMHSTNINEMVSFDPTLVSHVFKGISDYTKESGLDKKGFRIVTNTGSDSGQSIFHTHFHLLAGADLRGFGAYGFAIFLINVDIRVC